ncbi:MAG: hypothetical protein Q8O94_04265, partial [bacterium]|nr:hypothetical protein [bacterium]
PRKFHLFIYALWPARMSRAVMVMSPFIGTDCLYKIYRVMSTMSIIDIYEKGSALFLYKNAPRA